MTARELEERGVERVRSEVGPERLGEVELGVGRLPDEEVRQALLAAGPDDEVRVRQADRVQRRADGGLVDVLGRDAARGEPPERVDELGPAGVVEGDVEQEPLAVGGRLERLADRRPGRLGQLVEPAEQPDPDALGAELVGLAPDGRLEQAEQPGDLLVRPSPVLAAEGVQGQDRDAARSRRGGGGRGWPRRRPRDRRARAGRAAAPSGDCRP